MITIHNLRNERPCHPYDFYVDRRSPVGNPFAMRGEDTRDLVCEQYEGWFEENKYKYDLAEYLEKMLCAYDRYHQLRLFCWCAPKRCHAEIIKAHLKERLYGQE